MQYKIFLRQACKHIPTWSFIHKGFRIYWLFSCFYWRVWVRKFIISVWMIDYSSIGLLKIRSQRACHTFVFIDPSQIISLLACSCLIFVLHSENFSVLLSVAISDASNLNLHAYSQTKIWRSTTLEN